MSSGLKKNWRKKGFLASPESRVYILIVLGLIALGYLTFLGGTATRSADDFWYSSFFAGNKEEFFALTQKHYMTFNGRVIIHMVAQYVLYRGDLAFAVLMFCLMGAAPWLAEEAGERTWGQRLGAVLAFWLGVALLPVEMSRQGLTWLSAFCNYVLPTVAILLQIKLLFRFANKGGVRWGILCCLQSLFCGATTEQSGVVAICVALFSVLYCIPKSWKRALTAFCATLCALGGSATIFASPATQSRADVETGGLEALWDSLLLGLQEQGEMFFRYAEIQIAVVILLALLILLAHRSGKRWLVRLEVGTGVSYGIALLAGAQTPKELPWAYLACLCLLLLCALWLWLLGHHQWGGILLCALASLLVVLPTRSNVPRTMLPAVLYLLAVVGQMVGEAVSEKEKSWWIYPAIFGVAVWTVCPQIPIYWKNYQVELLNDAYIETARRTGVLYHCIDYDIEYTHTKAYVDGYSFKHFLDSEGFIAGQDEVYFYGTGLPKIYVDGERITSPAVKGEGGSWLLPLRDIVERLGGTVEAGSTILVFLADTQCYLEPYGSGAVRLNSRYYTEEWKGPWKRGVAERSQHYYCTCVSLHFYTDYLDLEVEFQEDEDGGAFYVTLPAEEEET